MRVFKKVLEGRERRRNQMAGGRRTLLDAELIEQAETLLKEGHYVQTICQYFGIHESTWYNWYNKGEEYIDLSEEELYSKPNALVYIEFYQAVKRGSARGEMDALNVIHKHSKKKWQAAAWFLERRFRDRWGRVKQDEGGEAGKGQLETFLKGVMGIVDEDDQEYEDYEEEE